MYMSCDEGSSGGSVSLTDAARRRQEEEEERGRKKGRKKGKKEGEDRRERKRTLLVLYADAGFSPSPRKY
jgi:hypothetical protein